MKQLFPVGHVIGYVSSLILSLAALSVVQFDLSRATGLTILLTCAAIQASVQLFLFMHIRESSSKTTLYINIGYAVFVGLVTVFGTLFTMVWGY